MVAVEGMVGLISAVALSGLAVGLGGGGLCPQSTGNGEGTVTKFVYERLIGRHAFGYTFAEPFLRKADWVSTRVLPYPAVSHLSVNQDTLKSLFLFIPPPPPRIRGYL